MIAKLLYAFLFFTAACPSMQNEPTYPRLDTLARTASCDDDAKSFKVDRKALLLLVIAAYNQARKETDHSSFATLLERIETDQIHLIREYGLEWEKIVNVTEKDLRNRLFPYIRWTGIVAKSNQTYNSREIVYRPIFLNDHDLAYCTTRQHCSGTEEFTVHTLRDFSIKGEVTAPNIDKLVERVQQIVREGC